MARSKTAERIRVSDVIERFGTCLDLVSMDPHFHSISVGLYVKDGTCTVWTFSDRDGVQERIRRIRDQLSALGGMVPVPETHDQARFDCGHLHVRPAKFLLAQAVGKDPDYAPPQGEMSIKDTKTKLMLHLAGEERDGGTIYQVSAKGDAPNVALRLRLVVAGFVRYGEMEKVGDTEVAFPCRRRHDELVRLILPYSRNVSGVESMMEAEAMRGQMTTGTLGFTPS